MKKNVYFNCKVYDKRFSEHLISGRMVMQKSVKLFCVAIFKKKD